MPHPPHLIRIAVTNDQMTLRPASADQRKVRQSLTHDFSGGCPYHQHTIWCLSRLPRRSWPASTSNSSSSSPPPFLPSLCRQLQRPISPSSRPSTHPSSWAPGFPPRGCPLVPLRCPPPLPSLPPPAMPLSPAHRSVCHSLGHAAGVTLCAYCQDQAIMRIAQTTSMNLEWSKK